MTVEIKGPWSAQRITQYLENATHPMRLASVGADGYPRVVSLWYRYEAGNLLCVTHKSAKLLSLLRKDNRVGFEVAPNEPPYMGVRGQGHCSIEPLGEKSTLEELLSRYLGGFDSSLANWLLSRSDEEVLITIAPIKLFAWDYSQRMADAG